MSAISPISPRRLACALVAAAALAAPAHQASAALFTLTDRNSVFQLDSAGPANNFNWIVNGTDLLAQETFYFRVGNAGPELPISTLPIAIQGTTDTNFDGNPDAVFVRYNGNGFQIDVRHNLAGGAPGSPTSDIATQISITNTSAGPLDFHFFHYADFDLSPGDATIFANPNTVRQIGGPLAVETVVTPVPSHRESALFPVTPINLNDANPTTLIDTPLGFLAAAGNMTWAYQWDVPLQPGASFLISEDRNLLPVPEPASALTLSLATTGLLLRRRRTR